MTAVLIILGVVGAAAIVVTAGGLLWGIMELGRM